MAMARSPRRAAGVRFEVLPPPLAQVLPRMDIALFVGFSASGPLQIPVAVDDPSHFESIFGADAALAWDPVQGATMNAYLAPAVRSYFLNGGQRCWVVRVAGDGATNEFPVCGMVSLSPDGAIAPATAMARSQGSWSDDLLVATVLVSRPLALGVTGWAGLEGFPASLDVVTSALDDVVVGDLMRLTFYDGAIATRVAMFVVSAVNPIVPTETNAATLSLSTVVQADGTPNVNWFRTCLASVPPGAMGTTVAGGIAATLQQASGGTVQLLLAAPLSAAPAAGTMLGVQFPGGDLWVTVTEVVAVDLVGSPRPSPRLLRSSRLPFPAPSF